MVQEPRCGLERHPIVADWSALADWGDWGNAACSVGDAERIPTCWPAHPGMVMELAGLRSAWAQAVVNDEKAKEVNTTVAAFHDYHFWPFTGYPTERTPCGQPGHKPDVEHQPTERAYFPPALADEETGETQPEGARSRVYSSKIPK